MTGILNYIKQIDVTSIVVIGVLLALVVWLYIKRSSPYVKEVVLNAVIEAENHFNSGEGQQKLHFAVTTIRMKLPLIFRVFITHRMLVTMIETTLNKISDSFELHRKVDIKGNENVIPKKIIIEQEETKTSFEFDTRDKTTIVEEKKDSNVELYANVKAKTDWRDNTETSVEVGFKKKL